MYLKINKITRKKTRNMNFSSVQTYNSIAVVSIQKFWTNNFRNKQKCLHIFVYFCIVKDLFILKGLHPGIVLERELKKRKLSKGRFALSINEFPQTLSAISAGKRSMNTPLALRIEKALKIEEGYFMTLQIFHEIREEKRKLGKNYHPDLSKLRKVLFWDTKLEKIDWQQHQASIIKRVYERGNDAERDEIVRFYGSANVKEVLAHKS